jgi:hypothetical protein
MGNTMFWPLISPDFIPLNYFLTRDARESKSSKMLIINDTLLMVVDNWLHNVVAFVLWNHTDTLEFKIEITEGKYRKYVNITVIFVLIFITVVR